MSTNKVPSIQEELIESDNIQEISSSHCSTTEVKLEKEEFYIKEEKDFVIKEEKDDISFSDITAADLQKWNEFINDGEPVSSTSDLKVEKSYYRSVIKDPFGLYTLLLWYYEDPATECEDLDRRIYLNKKCIENSFNSIGKCFVTCFSEETDKSGRIVGCVSFENESSALSAINDSCLAAKYNLELLILPSDEENSVRDHETIIPDSDAHKTKSYHDDIGSQGSTHDGNSSFDKPEFFSGLRRTIDYRPNHHTKSYVSFSKPFFKDMPYNFSLPSKSNINIDISQKPPSLLDMSFDHTPSINEHLGFHDSYHCAPNIDLDRNCNEFINSIRRSKDRYNQFGYSYTNENEHYPLKRKRFSKYKDLDAVEDEHYPTDVPLSKCIKQEKFMEQRTKWDELFTLVKSLIVPNDCMHNSGLQISTSSIKREESSNFNDEEYQYYHLLVKHLNSSRPTSSKGTRITRTKEDAMKCIMDYKERVAGGAKFEALTERYSDCSSVRSCDFKKFGPEKIVKLFAKAVSQIEIGAVSDPIVTTEGIHLLKRIT